MSRLGRTFPSTVPLCTLLKCSAGSLPAALLLHPAPPLQADGPVHALPGAPGTVSPISWFLPAREPGPQALPLHLVSPSTLATRDLWGSESPLRNFNKAKASGARAQLELIPAPWGGERGVGPVLQMPRVTTPGAVWIVYFLVSSPSGLTLVSAGGRTFPLGVCGEFPPAGSVGDCGCHLGP